MSEEINYAEQVEQLLEDKEKLEQEFGVKRAQFIELFKQKEDEFKKLENTLLDVQKEKESLQTEHTNLSAELDGIKTATAIAEEGREDEVVALQRQYAEETASMQHLIKEAVAQAHQEVSEKYQQEVYNLHKSNEKLQAELQEGKNKLSKEREGFLDSIAKTLQKKVGNPLTGGTSSEDENLEESMKKAQEDSEILKSVVMPLEEEITSLKEQLHIANQLLREAAMNTGRSDSAEMPDNTSENEDEKVKELSQNLKTEKSSRSDLEMYVAVLSAQKTAIQDEAERQKEQLQEVMKLLEAEKSEHTELRNTWQLATDQYLESQRLMLMDMRNMESLLSEEQQRQLEELKRADEKREELERKVRELEEKRLKSEEDGNRLSVENEHSDSSYDKSKGSLTSLNLDDFLKFEGEEDSLIPRSVSSQSLSSSSKEIRDKGFVDSGIHETKSLNEESVESPVHILTEEQQKAIAGSAQELKVNESVLAAVKAKTEGFSMEGKKLVSQHEWAMLQKELRVSRERLGKPCDMCKNYEAQLQQVQDTQKEAQAKARTSERQLEMERSTIKSMQTYTQELENSLKQTCLDAQCQISQLHEQNIAAQQTIQAIRQQFSAFANELQEEITQLTQNREEVHKELRSIEEENNKLIGKHSKYSQQLQEETINLPEGLEDMQLLLLTYREDVIASKVAKEHMEETLRSEIMFLKSQLVAEQQERNKIEEALSSELGQLQEELTILQSVKSELERQNKCRFEAEQKLKETDNSLKNIQAKSKQLIGALQSQVEVHSTERTNLEKLVYEQKVKIHGLQQDLDNSEAVQRDFVKLSQSLQIQLEKIRAGEHEVRWQYDDDVSDCTNCKKSFEALRGKKKVPKNHCFHCGKIFCTDCVSKTVGSGPKMRPSKVCDVCHTILVRDATPYFSTEPPHTPD